jgi:hypothetical protein
MMDTGCSSFTICTNSCYTGEQGTTADAPACTVRQPQGSPFGPATLAQGAGGAALTAATLPQPVRRSLRRG